MVVGRQAGAAAEQQAQRQPLRTRQHAAPSRARILCGRERRHRAEFHVRSLTGRRAGRGAVAGTAVAAGGGGTGRVLRRLAVRSTSTKKTGTKKIASTVAATMPPTTPVPIAFWLPAPAPARDRQRQHAEDEGERGHQDRAQAQARRLAPPPRSKLMPCVVHAPSANSTIRIAFFAARPIVVSRPTWK